MFTEDIPRLYTALAEWMSCMILLFLVPRRLKGWRFGLAAGGALEALLYRAARGLEPDEWARFIRAALPEGGIP